MKEIIINSEEEYTGNVVKMMIEKALQNERDEVKANNMINSVYSLGDIYNNKKVIETKNILAYEYKLKELIPAIELIGFDAVNEIIINKRKVKEKPDTDND